MDARLMLRGNFPTLSLLVSVGITVHAQVSVKERPYNAKGDGLSPDSASIQSALDAAPVNSIIIFPKGTYLLDKGLTVPPDLTLTGEGATLKADGRTGNKATLLTLSSGSTIKGLRFDGNGGWSSNPFVISNVGTVIGFSNQLIAVVANGRGTLIENCRFQGFGTFAVTLNGAQQTVINCTATNIGRAAFRSYQGAGHKWIGNHVDGVKGNQTGDGVTDVEESKFGDGFMIESSTNVVLNGNRVHDFVRIAYCVEGTSNRVSRQIQISGNLATDGHSARGTEFNAGVWVEGNHSDNSIKISGNTFENTGLGAMLQNGVTADANQCIDNVGAGITGKNFTARNNFCVSNWVGITLGGQSDSESSTLIDNVILHNRKAGIEIFESLGNVEISGNLCDDNGAATNGAFAGLRINPVLAKQNLSVEGNVFISSVDQGSKVGQLYAIVAAGVGNDDYLRKAIRSNRFVFIGRFITNSSSTIGIPPCSLGFFDGRSYQPSEILDEGGNSNTKLRGSRDRGTTGVQRR